MLFPISIISIENVLRPFCCEIVLTMLVILSIFSSSISDLGNESVSVFSSAE